MFRVRRTTRRGAAVVELALLLPLMMFIFLLGTDWCRIYFTAHAVQDCARNGALAGSGLAYQEHNLSYADRVARAKEHAMFDADNFSPPLKWSEITVSVTDTEVAVTVSREFRTITDWPGIGSSWELTRTVHMPILP